MRFKFPYSYMSRDPNMSIKLIQGAVGLPTHLPDGLICKMEIPASNYSCDDNMGTTLGMFSHVNHAGSDYGYSYRPMESPSYIIGSAKSFIKIGFIGVQNHRIIVLLTTPIFFLN